MRIPLAQLRKKTSPYVVEEVMDLKAELVGVEDILDCSEVKVKATFNLVAPDTYRVYFDIHTTLDLECAITLKKIPYSIDTTAEELYSQEELDSDTILIENQVLDTKEAVIGAIILAKPMKVIADDAEFFDEVTEEEETKEEKINPAFASLKDLL